MSSGGGEGKTRAQKGKVGRRDSLWDVIVNNDDICFQHILPRLNQTRSEEHTSELQSH